MSGASSGVIIAASHEAPGAGPAGLAWDGRSLWLSDFHTGRVYRLDPQTLTPAHTMLCPGNLSGLAWDGRSLWQAVHDEGWLRQINPETSDIDRTLVLDDHGWLAGVAWDGRALWTVSQQHGRLLRVDPADGQILQTWPVPPAGGGLAYRDGSLWLGIAYPMAFDTAYSTFDWVGAERHYALLQLDAATGGELARHALDFLPMGVAWAGADLWLSHAAAGRLVRARLQADSFS